MAIIRAASFPGSGIGEWPEEQGPGVASGQGKGAETSPWPRSGAQSATWLRGQQPKKGPAAGPGEHHFLGEGARREVPYRRSQEGPPALRVGVWLEQAAARKT